MREPTTEEVAIFAYVREYLRWNRPVLEADLTETDNLFEPGDDSVRFGFNNGTNLWHLYVRGYFNAARALLEGPLDEFFLTFAIYPVLFLYRHFIELELKGLMMRASEISSIPQPDFGTDHDLLSLWNKLTTMLPTGHLALENQENIRRLLDQFTAIDPKSMDTRYGLRRDLKTSAVPNPVAISIPILRRTMDRLEAELNLLEAAVVGVADDERREREPARGAQQNPTPSV
jgi:hypothetical protein